MASSLPGITARLAIPPTAEARVENALDLVANCVQEHYECTVGNQGFPDRLIDLKAPDAVEDDYVRIVTVEDLASTVSLHKSSVKYATLSHCWGECQPTKLLRSNIENFRQKLRVNHLPRLFQEAIAVARRLGYGCLWIDSLCIIQDDGGDWEIQAEKMADVYSNAQVCIAAGDAKDGTRSFLSPRGAENYQSYLLQACVESGHM